MRTKAKTVIENLKAKLNNTELSTRLFIKFYILKFEHEHEMKLLT